ncbi:MAG: GNAT family N-acetyltransferase [Bdellovibrionales bacterium]|nr:GNAT family N-acetyltransferase [Bdellovibrionales bacterium]
MDPLIFNTKRLVVRKRKSTDWAEWRTYQLSHRSQANQFETEPLPLGRINQELFKRKLAFIREREAADHSYFRDAFSKESGQLIGSFSVLELRRDIYQSALLGWSIHHDFWGQGYGTELVQAGIASAFKSLDLNSLEVYIQPGNMRSIKLAKRVGLLPAGRRSEFLEIRGELRDVRVFYLSKEQWNASF